MFTFLFDILPDTGHVRITLHLATMLHENGHEVYYTDSSDSVFTDGLIEKGIGRILYPGDFKWFTPDIVLLDYQLKEKRQFYQNHKIKYVFIAMQVLNTVLEKDLGLPVIYLAPSEDTILPSHNHRSEKLLDRLPGLKKDRNNIIIIGLLEESKQFKNLVNFYEIIKKSCLVNRHYQIVLLTHSEKATKKLFSLPDNMMIYRLVDLRNILPFCDIALISGNLNTIIEGVYANVPSVIYSNSGKYKAQYLRKYIKQGLGLDGKVNNITLEIFEKKINQILHNKREIRRKLKKTKDFFENENRKMEEIINYLINIIEKSK